MYRVVWAWHNNFTAMGMTASTRRKKATRVPSGAHSECDEDAISTSGSDSESGGEWDTLPPFPEIDSRFVICQHHKTLSHNK